MSRFLSPALSAVTPYTPGEQPQDQQYIKLNTNESPYLPSPRVVAAVSEAEVEKLRLYSDPACAQLLRTAAAHFGLQPSQVMPGNGSDENLFFALRAFCDESHPLAFADITYGCYGVWCGLLHIPTHIIPLKEDFTLDPADYHGLHETIVIANPNAPTGLCLPRNAIEGILQANPDSVVIVDEAYVDFGGESCVPLIDQYDNLLVCLLYTSPAALRHYGGGLLGGVLRHHRPCTGSAGQPRKPCHLAGAAGGCHRAGTSGAQRHPRPHPGKNFRRCCVKIPLCSGAFSWYTERIVKKLNHWRRMTHAGKSFSGRLHQIQAAFLSERVPAFCHP